jgi:6-phosphogluconolactonase (cycloisomerase 2 family)
MSKPGQLAFSGMVLFCTAILVACGSSSKPPQLTLSSLTIAPSNGEIYVSASLASGVRSAARRGAGESGARPEVLPPPVTATCGKLQYAATAHYTNGDSTQVGIVVTWSSSNTSVASIDTSGLATGVGVGTTNIGATSMGIAATSQPLAVDQLNSISVSPATSTVAPGASEKFLATGNFTLATGSPGIFDVSSQATWSSSDTNVATIDATGNATAKATGVTTITATSCDGGTVGQAVLNVGQPATTTLVVTPTVISIATGTTTLFTAMEKSGNTIQPPQNPVTWLSGSPDVASIDANSGVALGLTAGTSTIIATETVTGFTGAATLAVQPATARFAYVADAQGGTSSSGTISGYSVDVTSPTPLTPLPTPTVPAASPQQVLLHPSGDLMYYINGNGFLFVDDINSTDGSFSDSGQTPTPASTLTTGTTNVGVLDPTGRFIYVISSADNSIYGFSIAQTGVATPATNGALTAIPSFNPYTDATLNSPNWIMTDRSGKFAYVVNNVGNTISEYSIDQTSGKLSPLTGAPTIATGISPFYGTTDVNGHLYVANEGPPQTVSGYSINSSTGELTSVGADKPVIGAAFTINVITDPTGKYLYVLDSPGTPGQVFAYNLDPATGVIGSEIGTAQPTGSSPFGMAIDPTGVLMAIDNNFDNTISLFTIGATGSATPGGLTATTPPIVATDNQPLFVVFYTAASGQ